MTLWMCGRHHLPYSAACLRQFCPRKLGEPCHGYDPILDPLEKAEQLNAEIRALLEEAAHQRRRKR